MIVAQIIYFVEISIGDALSQFKLDNKRVKKNHALTQGIRKIKMFKIKIRMFRSL